MLSHDRDVADEIASVLIDIGAKPCRALPVRLETCSATDHAHPGPDELPRYYAAVCAAAGPAEVLAYVFPERTGVAVPPAGVAALAAETGIAGVKLSGEPAGRVAAYVGACPEDFAVFSGDDADLAGVLSAGGAGVVSGCSGAFPEAFGALAAALARDPAGEGSRALAARREAAAVVAAVGPGIGHLKYALRVRGLATDAARMAVRPPDAAARTRADRLAAAYGPLGPGHAGRPPGPAAAPAAGPRSQARGPERKPGREADSAPGTVPGNAPGKEEERCAR
ncbi:dihydrodipicolinate synthase family protein [Streptomyces hoynatensis]|nr:dihydrodipicolinate synthase family protein [Streptomyces hoynatensis]